MRIILGIILASFVATAAQAQTPTQAEIDACTPDAYRLCTPAIFNVFSSDPVHARVYKCLKSKRASLSPACRQAFAAHGL